MNLLKILLFLFVLFAFGCAGTVPQKVTLKGCDIEIGFKKAVADGYYLVLEKIDDSWKLIEYSESRINRRNYNQDLLFIDYRLKYAQPFFEKIGYFNGSTFECGPYMDGRSSYTPCSSHFTDVNLGLSFGKSFMAGEKTFKQGSTICKEIDREEIAAAIVQSGVLDVLRKVNIEKERQQALARERAAKCAKERELLAIFSDGLKVDIKIINQSGYPYPANLVDFKKEMIIDNSPGSLKNSCVKITAFSNSDNYVIEFDKKESKVAYGDNKNICIRSYLKRRKFKGLFPGSNYSNNEIEVYLKSIEKKTNGSIAVKVSVGNKTKKYITLKSISFYLNDKIYTIKNQNLELAPLGVKDDSVYILPIGSKWYSSWVSYIEGFIAAREANSKVVSIDVSAKYKISNMVRTLFKEKKFYYKDLVQLL